MDKPKFWMGSVPEVCDLCHCPINDVFIDGRLRGCGSWACMCTTCHAENGCGLGTGCGQLYKLNEAGKYVKIKG